MAEIKDIKVWKSADKKECRYYVHTVDGREGCHYVRGNHWHKSGSTEGDLTEAEWQRARELATWDGIYHTIYENEMAARIIELDGAKEPEVTEEPEPEQPQKAEAATVAKPERSIKTNRRGQHCWYCGAWVPAGEGELFYVQDDDEAMYGFQAGWLVRHLDHSICAATLDKAEADKAEAEAKEKARDEEREALIEQVSEDTGLEQQTDWSWDDYSYRVGEALAESAHYVAKRYLRGDEVIGFVVKDK